MVIFKWKYIFKCSFRFFLGIDIGSSSTKAAALDEHGTLLGTLQVHADDPRTSAYGVLGRFLDQQGASFDDVEKIVLTGLGSTYFHENIFGIPTIHALELDAIGHGGLYLSGLDEALVVSLGTGSAFIRASRTNGFRHLGGSGVGGGAVLNGQLYLAQGRGSMEFGQSYTVGAADTAERVEALCSGWAVEHCLRQAKIPPASVLSAKQQEILTRSEERRVGKECRSRWSPYH